MSSASKRYAVVFGATRPFGAEIVARLGADGFTVRGVETQTAIQAEVATPLDAFVYNAPLTQPDVRFLDLAGADFEAALDDQLYGLVFCAQAAVGRLKRGGAIGHVASRAHLGAWGGAHLAAAGAALVAMGRSMALELSAEGIRVNTLATDFVGAPWDTPAARADVANAVAFLAGEESRLVSGETILLNQTRSLRMAEAARR